VDKNLIKEATKQEIEKRLVDGQVISPTPSEVYVLRGAEVIEVGSDFIVVNHPDNQDPLMRIFPYESIKITVDVNNTIVRRAITKDPAQYEQEKQAFDTAINKESLGEPAASIIETSKLSDIQVGYRIDYVLSKENIKGKEMFLAQEILFSSQDTAQ
jgi:hypothetical protein